MSGTLDDPSTFRDSLCNCHDAVLCNFLATLVVHLLVRGDVSAHSGVVYELGGAGWLGLRRNELCFIRRVFFHVRNNRELPPHEYRVRELGFKGTLGRLDRCRKFTTLAFVLRR